MSNEKNVEQIMETGNDVFKTLVKSDHPKFGDNKFVRGKILAYQEMICDDGVVGTYPIPVIEEGRIFQTGCTPDKYEQFAKKVEEMYPGLCVFYYQQSEN